MSEWDEVHLIKSNLEGPTNIPRPSILEDQSLSSGETSSTQIDSSSGLAVPKTENFDYTASLPTVVKMIEEQNFTLDNLNLGKLL